MNYYPEFALMLNQELQRQDRSASWLAQRLEVSPSTVGRWLNHAARPGTPELVAQIADTLSITSQLQALLTAAGFGYSASAPGQPILVASDKAIPTATSAYVRLPKLPLPPTPLVGRDEEIVRVTAWLSDPTTRLVTIVGPGGMGKTRLALAVAAAQQKAERFEHGVAFADLAPISEGDQMPAAIAQAVGLPLESGVQGRSPEQNLIDYLHDRRMLLVLDNAEHLLDAADLVADILAGAAELHVLVTSRAPLRLPGEQLYPLDGLDSGKRTGATSQHESSAPALFYQTARRVRPNYRPDAAEAAQIGEICQLVEGMPLAIELAAAWVTLLSAGDILDSISKSLHFLETDLHGVPERHRSMEAVFDATWQRLSEDERQIFAQLSVFRGGFTQEAVRQITGAGINRLRALAASSLIVYDRERGRYRIHELLRQYGALRLADFSELEATTNAAHSAFYLGLLRRQQTALKNRGLQTDLQVLDAEIDNLSQAWGWAAEQNQVDGIVETLDGLGLYLRWRGRTDEGEAAFQSAAPALEHTGRMHHLAHALAWQAVFARILGKNEAAAQLLERSRKILDAPSLSGDEPRAERAFLFLQLGAAASTRNTQASEAFYRRSLALFEELNEQWFEAEVLLGLGHICLTQGDFAGQRAHVQRALDTYRTLGHVRGTASALSMLADIDTYRGRPISGLELGFESLAAFRSLGDPAGIATCLQRIGMSYMNLGDLDNARQVVIESNALFADMGSRRDQVIAYAFLCAIGLMAGEYEQALANAQRSYAFANALKDQFMLGVAVGFVGWAQRYTGHQQESLRTLREALTISTQTGASMDSVRSYSQLGLAQWQNGQPLQARAHCYESLRLAAQVGDPWSLLTSISLAIVILADGDDPERAVELYSMLMEDPLCTASQWFQNDVGPHVTAAMERLPDQAVEAALAKGKELDQTKVAVELVNVLTELGWAL